MPKENSRQLQVTIVIAVIFFFHFFSLCFVSFSRWEMMKRNELLPSFVNQCCVKAVVVLNCPFGLMDKFFLIVV
jgi:hypothetical protein